jgi:hypothetical protein
MSIENDLKAELSVTKVLVAILQTLGEVKIPTLTFLSAGDEDKELEIIYDEETLSFVFKLKNKEHKHEDGTFHTHD